MKNLKAINEFKKMLHIDEPENEHDSYQPSIKKLKSYYGEYNSSLSDSSLTMTEWQNGEGYDLCFTNAKNNDKFVSLHIDEIELLLLLLHKFNYFKKI